MKTISTVKELRNFLKSNPSIGLVPTMGALHDGHLSLVNISKQAAETTVVSIFVNPTQFAPHEDFVNYPRTIDHDTALLESVGVDVLFLPSEAEIYPDGKESKIRPGLAAQGLESDFRPHFFEGVTNVVHRLFEAVKPNVAVFGEKDYQQLQVIREMVQTLHLPIEIIGGPTLRDSHGLALSSRNAYLSDKEIEIARQLNKILRQYPDAEQAKQHLLATGFDRVDYVAHRWGRILAAAWIGKTRLIDNVQEVIIE